MASRLANSSSLYLQQHANNPVHWYEWGEEAWAKAKVENKPVFLSIGYSSCHWCHVMAHESFEDQEVATLLNEYFICIKLDREERPDIDETYMTAVQLATGHGGWPMSVFLTPEKKPFFAGTYFPKDSRQGQPGFLTIISSLGEAWKTQEDEIRKTSNEFASGLSEVLERRIFPKRKEIESGFLDQTVQAFHSEFDYENGGFGDQPKFPPHTQIRFLLNYATKRHLLPGDNQVVDNLMNEAAHMALFTLDKMASGGIHDHVGGGFHRYSTDDRWLLPHFEKMLYDNGQLLTAYSLGAESIEDKDIKSRLTQVQQKIISWLNSEMILENGLIASAIDADSPEGEGYFYTWTQNDLTKLLSENSQLLSEYQISPDGNYLDELTQEQTGRNILYQLGHYSRPKELDILYKAREKREKPTKDNKSILAWNSLACSGLLNSGEHTPALKCLEIWWDYFEKGSLPHQIVNNRPEGQAFLDDAVYFCESLIDAWQATENDLWKTRANLLMDSILITFEHAQGGFNYTNNESEILFGRTMPCLDQATPSPNGVAVRCLRRLGRREESLFHLAAILGWAQQLPTTCSTIVEECLEHLLLGEANVPLTSSGTNPEVEVSLGNQEPKVNETGFAETLIFIRIPNGYKINSHQPAANFLIPLSISIEGVYGEAAFAEEAESTLTGEVEIPIRLKKRSDSLEFSITVNYQLCSDTECYEPTAKTIEGRIQD